MTEIDNKKMWEYLLNNIDEPKIVVCIEEALEEQGLKYENGEIVSIEPEIPKDIEYTRTDAFIEKAVSYIQQHWIWDTKIIEDFRKYMKRE